MAENLSNNQFSRIILFVLNILFLLIGFFVMGLGIYIKINGNFSAISEIYSISQTLGDEVMQWIAIGMIIVGVLTAFISIVGCLGTIYKNRYFLYIYSTILILITGFEFAIVIIILIFRSNLWHTYDSGFMEIFHHAYTQNQTKTIKIIENLEREFQCCGVDGPSDYTKDGYKFPLSCYPYQSKIYHPFYQGCVDAVSIWVWNKLPIIAGILGGVLFIQIFGIISSLIFVISIFNSSENVYYKNF